MAHRFTRLMVILLCVVLILGLIGTPQAAQADTGSNWTGAYYANPSLQGNPVFTRIDQAVIFNWGPNPPGPGLGSQYWSARWSTVQFFNAGTYRFTITSDDGVRAYINGQLILDAWHDQAPTTYYVNVNVQTGNYALQIDYYQGAGDASISVAWAYQQTQSSAWTAQYYNNTDLSGPPALTRFESGIDYNWGLGSPAPGIIGADFFSARWSATLPFQAATYRFTLAADDGVRFYIDDLLVINQWRQQAVTAFSIDVPLAAGLHTLRVEYFEWNVGAIVRLSYEYAVGPPPYPGTQSDQWYGEYFANPNQAGIPTFIRLDGYSGLNFNWNNSSPANGFPRENFSVRWNRRVCGFNGQPVTFFVTTDDGARLWVDNTLVIDSWRVQSATSYSAGLALSPGCHIVRLDYFQNQILSLVNLTWSPAFGQTPPQYPGGGQPTPPGGTGVTALVTGASVLNVRTGPGINYGRITTVTIGQSLSLSARLFDNSWVQVTTPLGVLGWVNASYVTVTSGSLNVLPVIGQQPPPVPPPATGVRGKLTSGLRLRTGPSTAYPQIGILEWGTVVDVVGRSSDRQWLQVRYGQLSGWIYAPYVIIVSGTLLNVPITG